MTRCCNLSLVMVPLYFLGGIFIINRTKNNNFRYFNKTLLLFPIKSKFFVIFLNLHIYKPIKKWYYIIVWEDGLLKNYQSPVILRKLFLGGISGVQKIYDNGR